MSSTRMMWILIFAGFTAFLIPCVVYGGEGPIIAVFDIEERGSELGSDAVKGLTDFLSARLAECGYQVIPSDQIRNRILEQKKESYKACYSQECQIEMGRELAAQKVLSTQLLKVANTCQLTATLFDLKKAAADMAATSESPCREKPLLNALKEVASKLCESIGGSVTKPEEKESGEIPKIVVVHPKVTGIEVQAIDAVGLANLASSILADSGEYKVLSQEDVIALLGQEQQSRLLGCGDIVCMAEIGAAMGAPLLFYSNVGKTGETIVVSASMIDNIKVEVEKRQSVTVRGTDQVVDAMRVVTKRLVGQEAELSVKRDYRLYKWTALGVGIVGVILGITGTGLALHYQEKADKTTDQGRIDDYNNRIETWNGVSVVSYIAGGVALIGTLVFFLLDQSGDISEGVEKNKYRPEIRALILGDSGILVVTGFRF